MATKEQYESRLLSLGASKFENLIYDLLEKEFPVLHNLNHTGKVAGKLAARKGTPDIWFTTKMDDREKFVFVEVTTQKDALSKKIQNDLEKCKEHIENEQLVVEKIIYACLSKVTPDEFDGYQKYCSGFCLGREKSFEFWGIDFIVHLLKSKYPLLANKYLGMVIDSGSIVEICDYKNKFGVTEENKFLFRQEERIRAEELLAKERCIILSGPAGCGKTRLALEIMKGWEKNKGVHTRVLKLSGIGIEKDIESLLDDTTQNYLLLIDDANRISYLGNLINFVERYSNIFLILTIRDYAVKDILLSLDNSMQNIALDPLSSDQIKDVLKEGFDITDEDFIKRTIEVSRGNLRFAIMMAEARLGRNNIKTIPELMDAYFSGLKRDLKDIVNDDVYGKVLAAFAMFKRIYIKDHALVSRIAIAFEISESEFLDACDILEQQELLNYHFDNAIAEIADQILAEYLFYHVAIVSNKINLAKVFDEFFFGRKNHKNRIIELFSALFRSYGADDKILERVAEYRDVLESRKDDYNLMEFYLSFSDMFGVKILVFVEKLLRDSNITDGFRDKALDLLAGFCDTEYFQHAIDMLLTEYAKTTDNKDTIGKLLADRFTMTTESCKLEYACQKYLITAVLKLAKSNASYENLLFLILKKHFPLKHEYTTATHKNITIYHIPLVNSPQAKEYRNIVWGASKYLLFDSKKRFNLMEVINYGYYKDDDLVLRRYDKEQAIKIFDNLKFETLQDKVLGVRLLGSYCQMKGAKERIQELTKDPVLKFYADNINHFTGKPKHGDAFEKQVLELMESGAEYTTIIMGLIDLEKMVANHAAWEIGEAITYAFNYILKHDKEHYVEMLGLFIENNPQTQCQPCKILSNALEIIDAKSLLLLIEMSSLEKKINWKMQIYAQIKEDNIDHEMIVSALEFLKTEYVNAAMSWGNERATEFLRYEKREPGFILSVCKHYYEHHRETFAFTTFCEALYMNWEPMEVIIPLFDKDPKFMEELYFGLIERNAFCDYHAVFAKYFIDKNPILLNRFFESYISKRSEHISSKFLYGAEHIVDAMLAYMRQKEHFYLDYHLGRFIHGLPVEKFKDFILRFIQQFKDRSYEMFEISNIMEECSKEYQKHFVRVLVKENIPIDTLEKMCFFDGPHSWSNSRVPYIQANIQALSELLEEEKGIMPVRYFDFFSERLRGLEKLLKSTQIEEFNEDFGV